MQEEGGNRPPAPQQHNQQQSRKGHGHGQPGPGIIIFTISICLSCLYLQTQIFEPILNDRKALYMSLFTYFDVFMCLWSYFQTIRIKNNVTRLKGTPYNENQGQTYFDFAYGATQKKCEACGYFKFSRVSHCSTCGVCIYKMDHHCVWTQTCIGICNQKCFYLFCFYMTIGVLQFWYFTVRVVRERTLPILQMMEPGVVIIWVLTAFSAFFVGFMIIMLLISHTTMILTNHRTLDSMKTGKMCPLPFFAKPDPNFINLHDRGEIQNIKEIFGDNWLLWPFPLKRQIYNQFFPQKMNPHPRKTQLMKSTNVYEVETKYRKCMQQSPKVVGIFIGKKMRVNGEIFVVKTQE